jgi:hypothetical protein
MSGAPRHTSLEPEFRAAVPPQRAPLLQRLLWGLALRTLSFAFLQRLLTKKRP